MNGRRVALAAWLLACAGPGCVAWRHPAEPSLAGYPADGATRPAPPARVQVTVRASRVPRGADGAQPANAAHLAAATATCLDALRAVGFARDLGPDLAWPDLMLDVSLVVREEGSLGWAVVTAATLGLVPFVGGVTAEATAEVRAPDGTVLGTYRGRAGATLVVHLLFLAAWNAGVVDSVGDDALRALAVAVAADRDRLLAAAAARGRAVGGRRERVWPRRA